MPRVHTWVGAGLLDAFIAGAKAFVLLALLVVLRGLVKRSWLAAAIAAVVWPVLWGGVLPEPYLINFVYALVALAVVLRGGVLALLVATAVMHFEWLASAPGWSQWYGQAASLAVAATAALAVYGVWAAVARGRLRPAAR